MKYILVFGNPADGFEYVGPFNSVEDANQYTDEHMHGGEDWWIILLQEPAK